MTRTGFFAAVLVAVLLGPGIDAPVLAQVPPSAATARDAALRALANRLDLPLVEEAIAIFSRQLRRTLPTYFVDAVGDNANLGPRWKRGDPSFDATVRQVDAFLAAEESRGGPLLKLEHSDLLTAVNVTWTRDDIAFIDANVDTELGLLAQRAIDAKAALQAVQTLRRRIAKGADGAGLAEAFADLEARANARFGDALVRMLPMRISDPARTERMKRLLESVTAAPSDAIGERVAARLSQRLLDAAAAQLPALLNGLANAGTKP